MHTRAHTPPLFQRAISLYHAVVPLEHPPSAPPLLQWYLAAAWRLPQHSSLFTTSFILLFRHGIPAVNAPKWSHVLSPLESGDPTLVTAAQLTKIAPFRRAIKVTAARVPATTVRLYSHLLWQDNFAAFNFCHAHSSSVLLFLGKSSTFILPPSYILNAHKAQLAAECLHSILAT